MTSPAMKRIVCLANSRICPSGRCIAGKESLEERTLRRLGAACMQPGRNEGSG